MDIVRGLGQIHCTEAEAAAVLHVCLNTLKKFFKDNPEAREEFDDGRFEGKVSLRRSQFRLAKKSAAMGIWLGKQELDQKDQSTHKLMGEDGGPVKFQMIERRIVDPAPRHT